MNDKKATAFAALIHQKLQEIDVENALGKDSQSVVTLDQQSVGRLSRMDALQSQAMAKATQMRRDAKRVALLAALDRIEDGEFGYCADCGEEIAEKRLAFDPSITRCLSCASG